MMQHDIKERMFFTIRVKSKDYLSNEAIFGTANQPIQKNHLNLQKVAITRFLMLTQPRARRFLLLA